MDTNAQNTLVIIFQHVEIFFTMLDHYTGNSKTVIGFQVSAYENVIESYLNRKELSKQDCQRIRAALSIKNMNECCLLSFVDDQRGQFALQRGLLQTIQNLDSKRIRELGQPDLDSIYEQIKRLYDYFISKAGVYEREDLDFKENLAALMDVLHETLNKIDHNVRALEGSSKRLSEILDSHDFNQMVMNDRVRNALQEVIQISKRNIQPTLIFLNEKIMAAGTSAMKLIREIKECFAKTSFHIEYANISIIEMKLLSYADVISDTRRRMNRYVEMDRKQRELYNNIELRFNELHELVVSRLDSKLTGKRIPADAPIFEPARSFRGLVNWTSSKLTGALIELPNYADEQYVHEYIRSQLDKVDAINSSKRTPVKDPSSAKERFEKKQRIQRIKQVMASFSNQAAEQDLYLAIHHFLEENLKDYKLKDVFDALHFADESKLYKPTLLRGEIIYKSQKLSYLIRRKQAVI
uniref:Uncharacterized protein n=1 Tax=Rheinheimera sp. BAL341 TaxID=1708203 RepID=A0A486XIN0_9GAMM